MKKFIDLKVGQFFTFPRTNGNIDFFIRTVHGFIRIPNKIFPHFEEWNSQYCNNIENSVIKLITKKQINQNLYLIK